MAKLDVSNHNGAYVRTAEHLGKQIKKEKKIW